MPQIEVVFDIDANGILNVSAAEKSTGKSNKIVITNDKGRLSKDEIERMVEEAEKYKQEDAEIQEKIEAKNGLEGLLYQMKNVLSEQKDDKDKEGLTKKITEIEEWMNKESFYTKDEYDVKRKELEAFMGSMPSPNVNVDKPNSTSSADINKETEAGPTIEEID